MHFEHVLRSALIMSDFLSGKHYYYMIPYLTTLQDFTVEIVIKCNILNEFILVCNIKGNANIL